MDGNKPDKKRKLGLGGVFLIILMGILVAFFFSNNTMGLKGPNDNLIAADCASHLHEIGHYLNRMADFFRVVHDSNVRVYGNDSEALKGATIPDLLRYAAHSGELDETLLHCPATGAPFHVLSVPAMPIFLRSEDAAPIPIVMDAPGAHGKLGANVLFSDGSFKLVPPEEAEKIIARFSSVPNELEPEAQNEVKP